MFVDEAVVVARSGKGGHGAVSFRREKYIPRGGPDGGDGGRGGDVVVIVRRNIKTLVEFRTKRHFFAGKGRPGEGRRRTGADGKDVKLVVPPGTIISDHETGEVLADLTEEGSKTVILRGGRGGKGNTHFKSSRIQTPRFAQPGEEGEERTLKIELQLIADIGFLGLPNAGKSTLLKALTAANPKIGSYPFTTVIPNLGVLRMYDADVILADIPGIIRGASQGAGLGFRFLRHLSRTRGVAYVVDLSDNPVEAIETLKSELESYGHGLSLKPRVILAAKRDLDPDETSFWELAAAYPSDTVIPLSAPAADNLDAVRTTLFELSRRKEEEENAETSNNRTDDEL